jgi:hypothetical protein
VTLYLSFVSDNGVIVYIYPRIPVTCFHQTFRVSKVEIELEGRLFNTVVDVGKYRTVEVNAVMEDLYSE